MRSTARLASSWSQCAQAGWARDRPEEAQARDVGVVEVVAVLVGLGAQRSYRGRVTTSEDDETVAGGHSESGAVDHGSFCMHPAVPSRHYVDPQVPLEDVLARQVVGGP